VDKITVVCHKDHDKGYEDFQGKCLLCVVDELMLEMGNLMIQKQRAEKREWVGITDLEIKDIAESCNLWGSDLYYDVIELALSIEKKVKQKNFTET
jgi:hypothetical protein